MNGQQNICFIIGGIFDEDAENAKKMLVLQHKINIDNNSLINLVIL